MDSLPIRIFASAAVDISLAVLCGLMLARRWLGSTITPVPRSAIPAAILCFGGMLQLLSLTASFTGKSSLRQLCLALPDIVSTHAGAVLSLSLAASLALLVLTLLPGARAHTAIQTAALALCLLFRSGTGHAATERILSLPQAMQFLHLLSMSIWSGAILIAGLVLLPRLRRSEHFANFLAALSRSATWALAGVLLSGAYRGYTGLEGALHPLFHSAWGLTLTAKLAAVAAALTLGALNRFALTRSPGWSPAHRRHTTRTLRAEAFAMLAILALSATLANLPPPGD